MGLINWLRRQAAPRLAPNVFVENATFPWETQFRALWPEDFRKNAAAYREWAYVCTRMIADGVSAVPVRLYVAKSSTRKTALASRPIRKSVMDRLEKNPGLHYKVAKAVEVVEVLEHPFLDLLKNVNSFHNRFDLTDHTVINLELMGNAYWYKRRNGLGLTAELWNIPAQYMWIVPDKENFIKGYVMQRFGSGGTFTVPFDEADVIHFKYQDPNNLYYGISPLSAVAQAYNTQESLNAYTNAAFANMGRPEGILTTDGTISDENFERLKKRFRQQYAGAKNALKTLVMDQGVKYEQMSFKPVDMGTKDTRRDALERIAAAFRIPLSKLITENVNKANAEAGQEDFLRDTIIPRLARLEEKINEKLMPEYGPEYFVAFENPLPEDRDFRLQERESNIKIGYTTRNEERAKDGLPPLPVGGDALPSLDTGGTGATTDGEPEPPPSPPVIPIDDEDENEDGEEKSIGRDTQSCVSKTAKSPKKPIGKYLDGVRHKWAAETEDALKEPYDNAAKIGAEGTIADLELDVQWQVVNPSTAKRMGEMLEKTSNDLTDTTIDKIKRALEDGYANGESIRDLTNRVLDASDEDVTDARARSIAITEGTRAMSLGQLDVADKAGMELKIWETINPNPRPTHEEADEQEVEAGEKFIVGGVEMEAPGITDEDAPQEICNCDCAMSFRMKDEDEDEEKTKAHSAAIRKNLAARRQKAEKPFETAFKNCFKAQINEFLSFMHTLGD